MTLSREKKVDLFGEGEWIDEPDLLIYDDRGYICLVVRKYFGHLCGYVVIPGDHPVFGKDCDDLQEIQCHGGITFSGDIKKEYILFYVDPDYPFECDWAIGFDCGHHDDISPRVYKDFPAIYKNKTFIKKTYKNIDFVKNELKNLVSQLIEIEKNHV